MPDVLRDHNDLPLLDHDGFRLGDEDYSVADTNIVTWEIEAATRSFMMRNQLTFTRDYNGVRFISDPNALTFTLETTGTYTEEW
jgi:hypothetical protein